MLTRDAVVVLREAIEKAALRIREEKRLEEQEKKAEQEKKVKEEKEKQERQRAEAEAAAASETADSGDGDPAASVGGDVDAFDDLMIGTCSV